MTTTNETGRGVPRAEGAVGSVLPAPTTGGWPAVRRDQRGMVSAEWAVGIIAAIGIAGVLLAVVTSGPVEKAILEFILTVIRAFARGL
ncbi:Protein of unknown function [Friedmanniella luteola]|uniref:DUF4244 domain-containing protein n=1 Tax=Friedmanniella luteola TaxID=546871 RepID=A0A1H1LGK1_9ACTN|nr:DUF4244 domain-containing protein [Friedmanniella luteola]SDR73643.1 Protein of unknown function [Friedmanniella luteola]